MTISRDDELKICEKCNSKFHLDCWQENGGCATYGCENAPELIKKTGDQPDKKSYWGARTKKCPICGEIIEVYSEKCPYCGEVFEDVQPISAAEYKAKLTRRPTGYKQNRGALTIFIVGLLGITGPFNLVFGGKWYKDNKEELKEKSPLYHILAVLGLTVSAIYTFLLLMGIFFFNC
ncbi:MAG: hypothetical protein JSV88_02850 [Candidatus Aminicenantes bacterium]|nr:MAG: hypothetical protein JSV88_02850 [Candidatus Aminicenantes bacterium]